jgi:hypothetical protein
VSSHIDDPRTIDMQFCTVGDLSLAEAILLLAPSASQPLAGTDSPVDASEVFVETFLRCVSTDSPVRCTAQIVGRVEFRAGEGPLFDIGRGAVVIETTSADALFSWSDGDGHEIAAMPLSCLSRYIVQGCVVLNS